MHIPGDLFAARSGLPLHLHHIVQDLIRAVEEAPHAPRRLPYALFVLDDGEPHVVVAELAEAEALNQRCVTRALAMGGTCTGEHGIGIGKLDFLEAEHGDAVPVMRAIKQALDPLNVLNPGKVLRT